MQKQSLSFALFFSPTFCYTDIYQKEGAAHQDCDLPRCPAADKFCAHAAVPAGGWAAGRGGVPGRAAAVGRGQRGQLPRWPCWPRKCLTLPPSYIKCQPLPSRWPPPTAGRGGADALPGLWGGSAREICCWRGVAPARGPDQQRLHLPAPLAGGTAGGRGRGGAGCAGVLRFLGRGGGQVFPARLTVADTALDVRAFCDTGFSVQEPLSGRAVVLVRFGAVQSRLPPALGTYLEQHFAGAAPCPSRRWGCALFPAPPWPGTVSCRPSRPACAAPPPPAGQGRAEHLYAAFADLPRRLMGGMCWWGAKPSAAWRMGRLHFHTTSPCFRHWRRSSLPNR